MCIPLIQRRRISDPAGVSCSALRLSDRNVQAAGKKNKKKKTSSELLAGGC